MPILFDERSGAVSLHTDHSTYQMKIDPSGYLLHLYYGARTEGCMDHLLTYRDRGFSANPYHMTEGRGWSLDALPQEFPFQGAGDLRSPALIVRDADGVFGCDLRYAGLKIRPGKYALRDLPAAYSESEEDDAETLEILLRCERPALEVRLLYGVLPHADAITRSAVIRSREESGEITLEKAQSACLDFIHGEFEQIIFYGRHGMERLPQRQPVSHGSFAVGSRRGYSSHQYNPFLILCEPSATEERGRCWSMQLVYSGGFSAEAERDQYDQTRVQMGLSETGFSCPLRLGEELELPEVLMSFSGEGLGRLSQNHHDLIRRHICRGKYRDAVRPVLLNSWEACYFDFTGEKICRMAREAKDLGMDMIVMDDGWFSGRSDDRRALGDWTADEDRLGMSLEEVGDRIHSGGMMFGIWMEPEMVSEDSDLYRAHPDWALRVPGRDPALSRDQLVLDLSRPEVAEEIYERICRVLDESRADYLKWDANRSVIDLYSHETPPGRILYDYMRGLYRILERLCARYPHLLMEGCCGGGGRFDAGMLHYMPQIWCSDNTDPADRMLIQYGTSFGYPPCTMGSHVAAVPSGMTGRDSSLKLRAAVAAAGAFGYELDPEKLTEEEKEEIRQQIMAYRKDADLLVNGRYYRLTDPEKDPVCAWEFASPTADRAVVTAVVKQVRGNQPSLYVRPRGLKPGTCYRVEETGLAAFAEALEDSGFPLPPVRGDHECFVYHLRACVDSADRKEAPQRS